VDLHKLLDRVIRVREPVDVKVLSAAAGVLQDNPAYQQAREDILRNIVEQLLGTKPDATAERERLYFQAHALSQLEGQFNLYLVQNAMKAKKHAG
jgi:hypothetical protein